MLYRVCSTYYITFLIFFFTFASCVSSRIHPYHFNQKTAAPLLRKDVFLLKQILEANHPSLYWYITKDSLDNYFNTAIESIKDSLSETEFRNKVAYVISNIHCGHTSVRFSTNYTKEIEKNRTPHFPLLLKTWADTMVVIANYFPKDSTLPRGTIITSINGRTNKQILDSIFKLIGTDGHADNYKSQVISGNFPSWYKLAFGVDSNYIVTYLDADKREKTTILLNYADKPVKKIIANNKADSAKPVKVQKTIVKRANKRLQKKAALLAKRSLNIDTTTSTAYLRLTNFTQNRLKHFIRKSFKTLETNQTKNLIIDLRENTGGYVTNSNLLTKYLAAKPFKNADTLAAITNAIKHPYYVRESLKYWLCAHLISRKKADGRYHVFESEHHYYYPKKMHHFDGQIYILQGGYTFSAATMVTATLNEQPNVHIIGEESGGGYYGNTATYLPTIILPNSKLRIIMPMFRMVMDANRHKDGRGVMPQIPVYPTIEAIKNGIDLKIQKARSLISTNGY